jgi:hypothetical protein
MTTTQVKSDESTREPEVRISQIPKYFGGDGGTVAEIHWRAAIGALGALSRSDPVLNLVYLALDDAWAECMEEICLYGQKLGPDRDRNCDTLSEEDFALRTGKGAGSLTPA